MGTYMKEVCVQIIGNSCKERCNTTRTNERTKLETSYDKTRSLLQLATASTTPAPFPSSPAGHVFRRGTQVVIGEDGGATAQGCVHKFDCTECTFTMTASSVLAILNMMALRYKIRLYSHLHPAMAGSLSSLVPTLTAFCGVRGAKPNKNIFSTPPRLDHRFRALISRCDTSEFPRTRTL
jgi:hypothetical protein